MRHADETALGVDLVGERVHAAPLEVTPFRDVGDTENDRVAAKRRHLHTWEKDQTEPVGCRGRLLDSAERIVIGQRDRVVARCVAGLEHRRDTVLPVAVQ